MIPDWIGTTVPDCARFIADNRYNTNKDDAIL